MNVEGKEKNTKGLKKHIYFRCLQEERGEVRREMKIKHKNKEEKEREKRKKEKEKKKRIMVRKQGRVKKEEE